ncbi:MAG: leucyl/phenylalanyl-tRNA--protein transferase [Bacteroidia bacterium]|nr:leucyl/phenylalanyl-tRNA--protein transferase [Bacteroidia bacterium]
MPIYLLNELTAFPDPVNAEEDGLLAVGGDLSVERLVGAYKSGIFPWFSDDDPILWWSPDPRFVLFPDKFRVSKSLSRLIRSERFVTRTDHDFRSVIRNCAVMKRKDEAGTWITSAMEEAYIRLYEAGFAHSVEVYHDDRLVGGLYGVLLGNAFFGESMFHLENNSSKLATACLVGIAKSNGISFIDCQVYTAHLASLGAEEISRTDYLELLKKSLIDHTNAGRNIFRMSG